MPFANKIHLMGNLGAPPELRYFSNGTAHTKISVAYKEKSTDKNTGENKERTEWFTVLLKGKAAENLCRLMPQGGCVAVWGKLLGRQYTDKAGLLRMVYEIHADEFTVISTKKGSHTEPDGGNRVPESGGTSYMDIPQAA